MTSSLSGRFSSFDNRGMRSGTPRTASKKLSHILRALSARALEQGFPVETKFTTAKEMADYFGGERVICLRCGKPYKSLALHITRIHGWTSDEYKQFYGLPWRTGLSCTETKGLRSDSAKRTNEAGRGLAAMPKADRDAARALAHKAKHRAKTPAVLDGAKRRLVERNGGREFTQADFEPVLRLMLERDQTAKEVLSSGDLPSVTALYARMRDNPDFAGRYAATVEALSFAAQKRAQMLGRRFSSECFRLRGEGKTYAQIAELLHVEKMTVFAHLRRKSLAKPGRIIGRYA